MTAAAASVDDRRDQSESRWIIPSKDDPRWLFVCFHGSYVVLGHALLNFNRAPLEILIAIAACCGLDMLYTWVTSRKLLVPLSGLISALGLAILFTAPGNGWLMLLTSWICISSKYLITWRGRHIYNPTNIALVAMLLLSGGEASVAPAYQWGGRYEVVALVFVLGFIMMLKVRKLALTLTFTVVFVLGALVRAELTHMPAAITIWAQISGGAFWLFLFFMITDPKTSPASTKGQILFGAGLALVDMWLQLSFAVFSIFYALFLISTLRALYYVYVDTRARAAVQQPVP